MEELEDDNYDHTEDIESTDNTEDTDNNKDTIGTFFKGLFVGMLLATVVSLSTVYFTFSYNVKKGNIKVSDGKMYLDNDGNDESGIGSKTERKLNLVSNLLDESFYFDMPEDSVASDAILKGYFNTLGDKYTEYYTAEEYAKISASNEGIFYGIGVSCVKDEEDGAILIKEVTANSPAEKAGIKVDDKIVKVDDTDITKLSMQDAIKLVKGEKDSPVKLGILRGSETFETTAIRGPVDSITVNYGITEDGIGYIQVKEFAGVTSEQFKKALDELNTKGMKATIVDVRNNPGGNLSTVLQMLGYILPDGLMIYTEDKNGNKLDEHSVNDGVELNMPLAVLVNGNSASASELFSGAIQDYGKGKIVGTQTFGKGIVQTIKLFNDGSAIKYTKAKYFTPKGQDIHGVGITPDIKVELPQDATTDTQFDAAVKYLQEELNK